MYVTHVYHLEIVRAEITHMYVTHVYTWKLLGQRITPCMSHMYITWKLLGQRLHTCMSHNKVLNEQKNLKSPAIEQPQNLTDCSHNFVDRAKQNRNRRL